MTTDDSAVPSPDLADLAEASGGTAAPAPFVAPSPATGMRPVSARTPRTATPAGHSLTTRATLTFEGLLLGFLIGLVLGAWMTGSMQVIFP